MFGGHAYLRRTTGLTYAEYVHQGFGQLIVATLLTLAGGRGRGPEGAAGATPGERLLLRGGARRALPAARWWSWPPRSTGCTSTSRPTGSPGCGCWCSAFEGWLGLVVVLVLVAGITLRGPWLPRAALLTGAAALLVLAATNPDASIARHNLDRFHEGQRIDSGYLTGLSADALPTLVDGGLDAACLSVPSSDDWLEWNLGRQRGADALDRCPVSGPTPAEPAGR